MSKTYTKADYDDLIARMRKFFPDLCFLANLDSGAIAGPVVNGDGMVEIMSVFSGEEIGIDILSICGCGNPDSICWLFLNALLAIKKYWSDEPSQIECKGGIEDVWIDQLKRAEAHFLKQQESLLKNALDAQAGKKFNPTTFQFCDNRLLETLVLYDLDKLGWTDHGTSIYCSTITEKGETALELLELQYGNEESEKG